MLKYVFRRILFAAYAALFAFSTFVTGTLTLQGINQPGINNLDGAGGGKAVSLLKLVKDVNDNPTEVPLPGSEFYLYQVGDQGDVQIGGRYITDENGKISVSLSPGDYYFLETHPPYGYTYDQEKGGDKQRYPFTVKGDETDEIVVTAYNRQEGRSLSVTKTVVNEDNTALTQVQLDKLFTFQVDFSDGGTYNYRIDGGELLQLKSGETLNLKHGQAAVFENLPIGLQYTVTETSYWPYRVTSTNHRGNIVADGMTASFVNTLPVQGSLSATKTIENADGSPLTQSQLDREFTFTLTLTGSEDKPVQGPIQYRIDEGDVVGELQELPENGQFTLRHGQKVVFVNLPGGLTYTLTEEDLSSLGYTAEKLSYTGITLDQDIAENADILLPFLNIYDDDTDAIGNLEISKTIGGEQADIDASKEFSCVVSLSHADLPDPIIYRIDGGEPQILGEDGVIILKHGQKAIFENLPQGTVYTVTESETEGYRGSVLSGNGLILGDQTSYVNFLNYKEKTTDLVVHKIVPGETLDDLADKLFHFVLYLDGEVYAEFDLRQGESKHFPDLPSGVTYEVREDDVSGDHFAADVVRGYGTLDGDLIEVVWTNTFKGQVLTDISGEKTWDTAGQETGLPEQIIVNIKRGDVLVASIPVTQDENGKWYYTFPDLPKYDDGGNQIVYTIDEVPLENWRPSANGYDLVNTYVQPGIYAPVVEKRISGEEVPISQVFRFQMTAQDGAPMPGGAEDGIKIIGITDAGTLDFGEIIFTKAGTYVYTISELNDELPGFVYDTSGYTLTIQTIEEDNAIKVASAVLTKNEEAVDGTTAVFTNRYEEPNDDEIVLTGQKTWRHGENPEENWPTEITIYIKDGDKIVATEVITSEDGWQWDLRLPKYREDGSVIHYTIDEDPVDGYAKNVNGYNLVNTFGEIDENEKVTLSGIKTWVYGEAPEDDRPTQVTVIIKNGDKTVKEVIVTAANNWEWSAELPRYDKNGEKINYTVDEPNVPHYTSSVKGYKITNTYKSSDYPGDQPEIGDSTKAGGSKTGDVNRYIMWVSLMIVGLMGMAALLVPTYLRYRRVKRDEAWIRKNIRKY